MRGLHMKTRDPSPGVAIKMPPANLEITGNKRQKPLLQRTQPEKKKGKT
jgi:hypothetical protein